MSCSILSEQQARDMRAAAADPAYREMNEIEARYRKRLADSMTPAERFDSFIDWMRTLQKLGVKFEPNREPSPDCRISLL